MPRGAGWEEELCRLFDAYAPKRDNSWREYGEPFENETFVVRPYYWGDCTCGYDELEFDWSEKNKHEPQCYQAEYHKICERHKNMPYGTKDSEVKALCKKFDLEYPYGSAVHCTCDYKERWKRFTETNGHKAECPLIQSNFVYLPTGYSIDWYKYPLRDAYQSEDITLKEFSEIISKCIASV